MQVLLRCATLPKDVRKAAVQVGCVATVSLLVLGSPMLTNAMQDVFDAAEAARAVDEGEEEAAEAVSVPDAENPRKWGRGWVPAWIMDLGCCRVRVDCRRGWLHHWGLTSVCPCICDRTVQGTAMGRRADHLSTGLQGPEGAVWHGQVLAACAGQCAGHAAVCVGGHELPPVGQPTRAGESPLPHLRWHHDTAGRCSHSAAVPLRSRSLKGLKSSSGRKLG